MNNTSIPSVRFINLLIITLAVMVTYLNAVNAGFLIVDDIQLSNALESLHKATLPEFFRPGGDRYFRPLSMISCFLNYLIFGKNPAGFHLVNLLIHLANAQLVYFLTVKFMFDDTRKETYALIAALVFALHPVNTEAVIWVSARPDLLSCFFFLIAMILMVRPVSSALLLPALILFLSILCAFLSKESSLSLLALAPIYCFLERKRKSAANIAMIILPLLAAAVVYFYLRTGPTLTADKGLIKVIASSKPITVMFSETIAAYGFYVGKLFYPFPLSFTIPAIDRTLNSLFFLLFLPAAAIVMIRQKLFRLPLLIVLTCLIPPILALIGNLPVVPYAERYLYLSTTGFSLFTAIFVSRYLNKVPDLLIVSIVLLAAIPTVLRVNLWSEPVPFWHDAVSKSPGASIPHLALAAELINAGNYGEAERELKEADGIGYDRENIRGFAVQVSATLDRITAKGTPKAAP
jgi:protein O-mannosyl-transferase